MIGVRTSKKLKYEKGSCLSKNKFICERPRKDKTAKINYKAFRKSTMRQARKKCAAWKGLLLSTSDKITRDIPFRFPNSYWL